MILLANIPCVRCHTLHDEHVGGKCVFSAAMYKSYRALAVSRALEACNIPIIRESSVIVTVTFLQWEEFAVGTNVQYTEFMVRVEPMYAHNWFVDLRSIENQQERLLG